MARVTILDKDGYSLGGDIRASTIREYIKNADPNPGKCTFRVSRFDTKNNDSYLRFGNYVLVRDSYLPDWIGVIVDRVSGFGGVEITAMQAEYVLAKRNTKNEKLTGTAGSLFTQILRKTNAQRLNEKPIRPGNIYTGGISREETTGKNALDHIKAISSRSGNDFDVQYDFDTNTRLYLTGNWYQKKGFHTEKYLREGLNIKLSDNALQEDTRQFANYLEGRGDASTDGTRPIAIRFDEASIDLYGLNQEMEVFSGNKDPATVRASTIARLAQIKNPLLTFDVTAINVNGLFGDLDVCNLYYIDYNTMGYTGDGLGMAENSVELLAMEANDSEGTCRLILERREADNE